MPAEWSIDYWPRIGCHVFLSHCAEDRDGLIFPVYERLREHGIIPWIDRHDFPLGRSGFDAIREELCGVVM